MARAPYATRPRELIAGVLQREHRFLSAAEVYERLKPTRVSLSTVYRTLEYLQTRGEVAARVDADGESAFVRCEPQRHHHHAICNACGRVEDVDCEAVEQFADALRAGNGFQLDGHAMEFFGRCRTCR